MESWLTPTIDDDEITSILNRHKCSFPHGFLKCIQERMMKPRENPREEHEHKIDVSLHGSASSEEKMQEAVDSPHRRKMSTVAGKGFRNHAMSAYDDSYANLGGIEEIPDADNVIDAYNQYLDSPRELDNIPSLDS